MADKGAKLKELDQAHASCQELQAQLVVKNQEIQKLQAELETRNEEPSEQTELLNQESGTAAPMVQTKLKPRTKELSGAKNGAGGSMILLMEPDQETWEEKRNMWTVPPTGGKSES